MTERPSIVDRAAALLGRHVELRLIGAPGDVDRVLAALSGAVDLTAGTRKPTRDRDGRVIQYAAVTVPPTVTAVTASIVACDQTQIDETAQSAGKSGRSAR